VRAAAWRFRIPREIIKLGSTPPRYLDQFFDHMHQDACHRRESVRSNETLQDWELLLPTVDGRYGEIVVNLGHHLNTRGMWAITSYFNPIGYRRRLENYRSFREHLNIPLLTVELGYGPEFELDESHAEILIRSFVAKM
jgi:hypothetical protein